MERSELIKLLKKHGDAVVNYTSSNSNKFRYTVCTTDFSTKYIKEKGEPRERNDGSVLVFAWDADSFKHLDPASVTSVKPLSDELQNRNPREN